MKPPHVALAERNLDNALTLIRAVKDFRARCTDPNDARPLAETNFALAYVACLDAAYHLRDSTPEPLHSRVYSTAAFAGLEIGE
jgi:hypothetical protein